MDRLTNLVWKNASSNVIRSFAYQYNSASMITNIGLEDGFLKSYSYDDLDQLVSETSEGSVRQYLHDQVGNRTQKVWGASTVNYTYSNGCNRLTGWTATGEGHVIAGGRSSETIGTNPNLGQRYVSNSVSGSSATPAVSGTNFLAAFPVADGTQQVIAAIGDEAGNTSYATNTVSVQLVTNAQYGYNSAGCVTNIAYTGSGFSENIGLTWNGQYQLTEVTTNGAAAERNGFDALGRRVWNWDGTTTNYMVYDGPHVLAEVDSTGGLRRAYTHGPGIDNWLAITVYTGATAKTYFYLTDHQGTVHAVADETGNIVESYRFDAWGRVLGVYNGSGTPLAESAIGNKILWQGREYSWKTGLYFFRARWYDPITGRWLSNDPIGISGGLNQYVFCANNPVNFVDPDGLRDGLFSGVLGKIARSKLGQTFLAILDLAGEDAPITGSVSGSEGFAVPDPLKGKANGILRYTKTGRLKGIKMFGGGTLLFLSVLFQPTEVWASEVASWIDPYGVRVYLDLDCPDARPFTLDEQGRRIPYVPTDQLPLPALPHQTPQYDTK